MTQHEYDMVIIGSGAAGMTAALTAAQLGRTAIVLEKTSYFGGSTARSGGGIWAPNNAVLREAGVRDTAEMASEYLAFVAGDDVSQERRDAYLRNCADMIDLVLARTPLKLTWVPGYADYYPEAAGGVAAGRSVEPVPFNGNRLGAELARLNKPYLPVPDGMAVMQCDYRWAILGPRHPRAMLAAAKIAGRLARRRIFGQRMLSLGQALAAGLRAGLVRGGIPVWLDSPMTGLVTEDGRVTGVTVTREREAGSPVTITARLGVLLACGGFEHNQDMRKRYQREPIGTEWTTGSPGNTGDGITAGVQAGAALALMDDAWWGPTIPLPGGPYFCLGERNLPGSLMVNAAGQRYVNECAPYVDAVHAMYDAEVPYVPSWLIFDQRYRDTYVFAGLPPRRRFSRRWYAAGTVFQAPSLAELATSIGVDAEALGKTVARFNDFARSGVDEDFHRGDSAYDRYYGDPRVTPNPNLAALAKPPFYAVKIMPGDLGTKGGLVTDAHARVLREDGSVIAGLYAAGNVSAAVMGHSYAGAGATIGPAMTFGYLAAKDMLMSPA
jgi:3-oxosteroid 1-dehydrogenase